MFKKVIGLIVIITGILLLLSNLDIMAFDDFSGMVFSMGIMIVGLAGLYEKKRFDLILFMFVIFGGLYFASNLDLIAEDTINTIFWPTVIIAVGLSLLFSVSRRITTNKPVASYVAVFSGVEDKNVSNEYVGSEIIAVFGGADIDYSKIKFKENKAYINVTVAFGGATIIVPKDIKVTVKGLPIFGGAENKAVSDDESKKELIIDYTAIFGGVEIKN